MESSWIFFIATLAIMTLYFVIYCSSLCFYPLSPSPLQKNIISCVSDIIDQPVLFKNCSFICHYYAHRSFFFPYRWCDYLLTFHHLGTTTCTNVEMVRLSDQISRHKGLHCFDSCTYSSDDCTGLRSVGAGLTGLWNSQSDADLEYKKTVFTIGYRLSITLVSLHETSRN